MAHIIVLGAGLGGMPAAYDLKKTLGKQHEVTLVNASEHFQFTPSNPWVTVGWRKMEEVLVPIRPHVEKKKIRFVAEAVSSIDPQNNSLQLANGETLNYDYLVIATGPRLAFEEIPGLGPQGHSHSVCTSPHAAESAVAYEEFLRNPGPVVVGAVQGASCFGPAYEFAMILDADLRKRKIRDRVPMTFVTSEPYVGHMGLGGVGDSKNMLESQLRQRHIKWITNAKIDECQADMVKVTEHDAEGKPLRQHELPSKFNMFIPAFKGVDAVAAVEELCNPRGFVLIDEHQRNPTYPNIYSAGVCVAIPPVEVTPVPTGAPKTGYMIESMVTAIVHNIEDDIAGRPVSHKATWNAICLADLGDDGVAFVALPQIPPRNLTWAKQGKWVHLAKIAFEKYFMRKMRTGNTEPIYEKYVLKALGIVRLKSGDHQQAP
ncbi:NAD(P)/FAD-dependent oxidoreductase [Mangrovimicrobium sediminis]|uniref:Sulfide-quinone reductase n=1 Tax=Mangrovimicrobium sediminis TaxID=2562682 RepID=A0A4Z0M607_9GAMM|nr:FAD/NAD(P)-binding oxidoreductase [Haliea sp. SAOS-164]TGD74840.1 NAD(P)/FAD-dependent oxidoreductase [Haliea sp. SAOS-164]